MELITYSKQIKRSELKSKNIVIGKDAKIDDGVRLGVNVCLLGFTKISEGSTIHSNSVLEDCDIEKDVEIKSSFLEKCVVKKGASIGPFAHIRANTVIGENCRIGNFVEIKNSTVLNDTKIAHLTYVGDAKIGKFCNIGCGVVFCNYNGKIKQSTIVGDYVFIGSNCNIVAPLKIEDYAFIAAGSTITQNVQKDELAIARTRQTNKQNFKNLYKEKFEK